MLSYSHCFESKPFWERCQSQPYSSKAEKTHLFSSSQALRLELEAILTSISSESCKLQELLAPTSLCPTQLVSLLLCCEKRPTLSPSLSFFWDLTKILHDSSICHLCKGIFSLSFHPMRSRKSYLGSQETGYKEKKEIETNRNTVVLLFALGFAWSEENAFATRQGSCSVWANRFHRLQLLQISLQLHRVQDVLWERLGKDLSSRVGTVKQLSNYC